LLPIVIFGQPELNQKLDHPDATRIKQRIALRRTTHPLVRREVGPYIESRLRAAGACQPTLFDPEAVESVALYSGGIPRLINSICDNALLLAYLRDAAMVSREIIEQAARDLRLPVMAAESPAWGERREVGIERLSQPASRDSLDEATDVSDGCGPQPAPSTSVEEACTRPLRIEQHLLIHDELQDGGKEQVPFAKSYPWDRAPDPQISFMQTGSRAGVRRFAAYAAVALTVSLLTLATRSDMSAIPLPVSSGQEESRSIAVPRVRSQGLENPRSPVHTPLVMTSATGLNSDGEGLLAERERLNRRTKDGGARTNGAPSPNDLSATRTISGAQENAASGSPAATRNEPASKTLRVSSASLVRKQPGAGAEIIASLEAGTRVVVVSRSGDFYKIRSVGKDRVRGYIHREDAFFEGAK
jgi:hypothetical protein